MNPDLINFIKSQQEKGIAKETIIQSLLLKGWPQNVIDQGFQQLEQNPTLPVSSALPTDKLLGPVELLHETFVILKKRILTILALSLLPVVLTAVGVVIMFAFIFAGFSTKSSSVSTIVIAGVIGFVVIIAGVFINAWFQTAMYYLIVNHATPMKLGELLKRSLPKVISFGVVAFLASFIVGGGFLLFIVPGVLFGLWFSLALYITLAENKKGMDALLTSREYVRGYGKAVFGRMSFSMTIAVVFLIAMSFLTESISSETVKQIVNTAINMLTAPFFITYWYLIYENLRAIKGPVAVTTTTGKKAIYIVVALLGIALTICGLFFGLKYAIERFPEQFPKLSGVPESRPVTRSDAYDLQRMDAMANLQKVLTEIKNQGNAYPHSLTAFEQAPELRSFIRDPETNILYEYKVLDEGDDYELCTTFGINTFKEYKGYTCFTSESQINYSLE